MVFTEERVPVVEMVGDAFTLQVKITFPEPPFPPKRLVAEAAACAPPPPPPLFAAAEEPITFTQPTEERTFRPFEGGGV